jgi:isovaleryl-CoA dehydrogenase
MQACCDTAFEYAHVRKQFGKPIGSYQVRLASALSTF